MEDILFSKKQFCFFSFGRWRYLPVAFLIFLLTGGLAFSQCNYTIEMSDDYGDGWNGGKIDVLVNGSVVLDDITISSGSYKSYLFSVNTGDDVTTAYSAGSYSYENGYRILDANGSVVFSSNYAEGDGPPSNVTTGTITANCPSCSPPASLTASNITLESADLSWTSDGDTFDISWGEGTFTAEDGTIVNGFENGETLSGLTLDTMYQYYVRNDCGGGDLSDWAGPYSFMTVTPGQIGDGAATSENLPITSCYGYTYSQQIYLASEIANAGNTYITKIRFKPVTLPSDMTNSNNWTIYMGNTEQSTFTGSSNWVPFNQMQQVFSGTLSFTAGQWVEIQLATPFTWDGTSNVVVGIDENASSWNCTAYWASYDAGSNRGMAYYNDNTNPNPASPQSANYAPTANIPQIQIVAIAPPSCFAPTGLTASNITTGSADLSWTSDGDTFDISWGEGSFNAEGGTIVNGFENGGTLSGLGSNITYQYYVRNDCGGGEVSTWAGPYSFLTLLEPATLDFSEGFEGTNLWILNNGSQTNKWYIGNAVSNGGAKSLYISNNSGTSNNYSTSSTSTVHAYRDIVIPPGTTNNVSFSFNWKSAGESGFDYARVWLVPTSFTPTAGTQISSGSGRIQLVQIQTQSSWQTYSNPALDLSSFAGTTMRLVFEWRNDSGGGSNPPAAIDNISMSLVSCPAPTGLSHNQLSMSSAELSWTSSGSLFELKWGEAGFDVETEGTLVDELTETSYILEGLTIDVNYAFYVRSDCDTEGFSSWTGPHSFSVGYCTVSPPASNDDTGITYVEFNTIDNPSGTGTNNTTNHVYYSNFTNISTDVQAGQSYDLSVNVDTAGGYMVWTTAWIDWNNDGVFDTNTESYNLGNAVNIEDEPTSNSPLSIEIPIDASGEYRMRIKAVYGDSAIPDPCATQNYSETEDYTINVLGPVTWTGTEWINGSPSDDISVLIDGSLSISNDAPGLEVNDMFVSENGSVAIESENTLTINGKITNNAGAAGFVIESGGNLIQNGTAVNVGNITVKRDSNPMIRLDYTLWSSPVTGQNLFDFSPETVNGVTNYDGSEGRIYIYDGANGYVHPDPFEANTVMNNGAGYLFRSPNNWSATEEAAYEGVFTGVPFNGDKTVSTHAGNYTSIGNPYPSNISVNSLVSANTDIATLYFWNNNHGDGNNYATCTNGVGCTAASGGGDVPNGTIAVGQGFIVGTSSSSVSFNNDMRVDDNGSFFKVDELESHRIWLNLNGDNEAKYNQVLVGYVGNATNGIDNQIDGEIFGYQGSALYSLIDGQQFVIQGRALPFEVSDVVPLGFRAAENGKFTVSLANFDGVFAEGNVTIYLRDNQLHVIHNLMESDYDFESAAGEFNERFDIIYGDEGTMGTSDLASGNILIYKYDHNIVVESKSEKILSVELFDLQGRNLFRNEKVNANVYQIRSASFGTQVLVVRVQTHDGVIETKKVINN